MDKTIYDKFGIIYSIKLNASLFSYFFEEPIEKNSNITRQMYDFIKKKYRYWKTNGGFVNEKLKCKNNTEFHRYLIECIGIKKSRATFSNVYNGKIKRYNLKDDPTFIREVYSLD